MVLTALREKGELSAVGLNARLRARLNPMAGGKWAVGDRVIQTSNNYELDVMNGDIGTIVAAGAGRRAHHPFLTRPSASCAAPQVSTATST